MFEYTVLVPSDRLALAHHLLAEAVDALSGAVGPVADDAELVSLLTVCEGAGRRLDRLTVGALADLERRGMFAERGYRFTPSALGRRKPAATPLAPPGQNGGGTMRLAI